VDPDPYRSLYVLDHEDALARAEDPYSHEERALVVLLVVLGLARLVPAVWVGEAFGTEATIAVLMLLLGLSLGLSRTARRLWKR